MIQKQNESKKYNQNYLVKMYLAQNRKAGRVKRVQTQGKIIEIQTK